MKYILTLFIAALSVCAADSTADKVSQTQLPQLRTEHEEKRDEQGEITTYIDTVYRGSESTRKDRILRTVKFKKGNQATWATWRTFYLDGQAVMVESNDGDSKVQTVVFLRDGAVCEVFKRLSDGSVEAVTSQELAKLRGEMDAVMGGFGKVIEEVRARIETNSPGKVRGDLKADLEQYKQEQKTAGAKKE